jgi:DNA-binding CsgD family transcriptional regulator
MIGWFSTKLEEIKVHWKSKGLSDEEIDSILGLDNDTDAGQGGKST